MINIEYMKFPYQKKPNSVLTCVKMRYWVHLSPGAAAATDCPHVEKYLNLI